MAQLVRRTKLDDYGLGSARKEVQLSSPRSRNERIRLETVWNTDLAHNPTAFPPKLSCYVCKRFTYDFVIPMH